MVIALLLLELVPGASAAGLQAKTMRAPLPAVEVERGLTLPRGWLELGVTYEHKLAAGAWSPEGERVEWEDARWLYTTQRLDLRYGISPRAELYWSLPFHYVRLTNEALGTDTSTFGLGDARFGWRVEWLHRSAPTTSVASSLEARLPTGSEAPGSLIGGANTVSTFVLGTGQMDLAFHTGARQQLGPVAVTVDGSYTRRFSGVTQYTVEVEQYQFLGRFKPGDEGRLVVEPGVQAGPVYLAVEGRLRAWLPAAVGTTSAGVLPDGHLEPLAGTGGWAVDVTPSVTANVSRGVDLRAAVGIPVRGEDLSFFPLEEISPTRGLTWSGGVELRY